MKLFNTLGRKKQEFKPIKKGVVSMYTCGPTVYQYAHIGNLRAYLAEDILRRTLEYNGYKVKQVMNITDVGHLTSDADTGEDKVEVATRLYFKCKNPKCKKLVPLPMAATKRAFLSMDFPNNTAQCSSCLWMSILSKNDLVHPGVTAKDLTEFYAEQFVKDLKALNIELPMKFGWASKYVKEQIALIQKLEKKGYTYRTTDGIYFDTAKFKKYGALGRVGAGKARVLHSPEKKRETDFALWKFSGANKRQQEWRSPWGVGFPGWHIECSAISAKELGQPFDIHTGGEDHIAVHHNDEIAQSEAAYGKPLANYWFHNAFMVVNGAKMAKSAGNFYTLADLEKQGIEPMAFRYLAISGHYRSKLSFSGAALKGAQNALNKLRAVFDNPVSSSSGLTRGSSQKTKMDSRLRGNDKGRVDATYKKRFLAALNDDLNMPKALAVVWELLKSKKSLADKQATLLDFDKVLGLELASYKPAGIPVEVKKLVAEREKARKEKDWKKADEIRKVSASKGYVIEDTVGGPKVYRP